ncbi:MAG: aminotransferase class IV [Bacillota bacterium]|nr:aminotransferase class IV [Bacillota bacterium]
MSEITIHLDEGYMFGLGAFETIAIENSHCVLLKKHLDRLKKALEFFQIDTSVTEQEVLSFVQKHPQDHGVLKIMVSEKNVTFTTRSNPYEAPQHEKGFVLGLSQIRRNETSPLTYHKTFHYGDCLMEKRAAKARGWDEPIFLNTKGALTEGAATNLFFVRDGEMITPALACGMLNGILRQYICSHWKVTERVVFPEEIGTFEECFVTNSLMGIMPVRQFENKLFSQRIITETLRLRYEEEKTII